MRLRQFVTIVTIAALAACALGIPLPLNVKKQAIEAYPCMNCPCSCKDAEACWRDCCCFTQEEKLAWARDNGIIPPAFVLAAVEVEPQERECASCCCKKTCCSSKEKPKCCSEARVCERPTSNKPRSASATVLIFQALRCQGLTSPLTVLPPSVMPKLVVHALASPPAGEAPVTDDLFPPGPHSIPDTPPPQHA